jgi:L-fuconolactonase
VIVDAHHHLWDPAVADYPWMTDGVAAIRRRFGTEDLEPVLREHGVDGTIVVQARSSLDETRWLLEVARTTPFVLGVVGWVDITAELPDLDGPLVGIRHQVHDEPSPEWLLRPDVQRGIASLGERGLVYDLLVRTRELPAAIETARRHPGTSFVVDHLAKPPVRDGGAAVWEERLATIAALPNVSCKLSGLVTEADWRSWTPGELGPYLRRALDLFGADRCMFGSDWPVCLLAAQYGDVLDLLLGVLDDAERTAVLGGTAARVYNLEAS